MGRKSSMQTTRGDATAREDLVICDFKCPNLGAGRYRTTGGNHRGMGSCYNPRSTVQGESFSGANRHLKAALISGSTAKIVWPEKDRIGWQHRRGDKTFLVVGMVPLIKKQPGPVAKPVRVPVTRP